MNPHWITAVSPNDLQRATPPPSPSDTMTTALGRILRPEAIVRWNGWMAKDYTPERIETVLRGALWGDHVSQWELFHVMEPCDPVAARPVGLTSATTLRILTP